MMTKKVSPNIKKIKQSFTSLLINSMQCPPGKSQFLYWDFDTPNFGVRVTASGNKAYIFESSLNNKTIRITIGNVQDILLDEARQQAIKLKSLIRMGIDPRKIQNKRTAQWVSTTAIAAKRQLQNETLKTVWINYANAHYQSDQAIKPWSKRRYQQHMELIDSALAPLASIKMADLSVAHIKTWGSDLSHVQSSHLRFNAKLCLNFLKWCNQHDIYQTAAPDSMLTQMQAWVKSLNQQQTTDYLSKKQLKDWFHAVNQIEDTTTKAYLKTLLLTGRRANEILNLKWSDIDFKDQYITLPNGLNEKKKIPLTEAVASYLSDLPKTHDQVFHSLISVAKGEKSAQQLHRQACHKIGLKLSIDDLFTSFTLLTEWVETPAGITAQLQDLEINGTNIQDFAPRPIEILQIWQQKIQDWILQHAEQPAMFN